MEFRGQNFLVIGRAGMDLYPDPPGVKTEEATQFFSCLGGSSANIAVALVQHGCSASLVTTVSDDAIGRFAENELDKYLINRDHVRRVSGECRTSLAVVESRIEDHQSVIYRNNAADFYMDESDITGLDYASFHALITTGTVLAGQPSRDACFSAFDRAKAAGLPLIFDIDYRPYSWSSAHEAAETYTRAAKQCDMIIGNDDEFGVMAGSYDQGLEFARSLVRDSNRTVVYKMGAEGAMTMTRDTELRTGIFPVTALKPTGAGDSFMGGLIASLANGFDLQQSVIRGSACAAMVVMRVGCAPAMPSTAELEKFLGDNAANLTKG